ncbi:MAG TPA: DUF6687 family protein [Pyrinomonadaceae bacterium]|nr:DUF6687 family protein [Pyrinomonadaceae bacterium]
MRFEYHHAGLADVPKLSVDGVVPNAVHLSHWQGNHTPAVLKADTSTEIALNLVAAPDRNDLTKGIELVTNNHFDTDGVLSVWTVLTGARALDLRAELIAAAEAGDFSEYTTPQAIRASLVIQGSDAPVPGAGLAAPVARQLNGGADVGEARAYELVLPEVERVLTHTDEYEHLWRAAWTEIERALESFAGGASRVVEDEAARLSVVTLAPDLYGAAGFSPTRHAAPYTAIARHARGALFLIAIPMTGGWAYRIDYPYYSWAETVVRPPVVRRDLADALARLNESERKAGVRWQTDASELTSAAKSVDDAGLLCASSLAPDEVAAQLRAALRAQTTDAVAV